MALSKLKICSWNILAPELLFYFWRSSYGLEFVDHYGEPLPAQYYNGITLSRIHNIINYLIAQDFDIILLQEVTTTKFRISQEGKLEQDGKGIMLHELIATELNYAVVSESFKTGRFDSGLPPFEQDKNKVVSSIYSGVATLAKRNLNIENVLVAKQCKKQSGSPFTIDHLAIRNKNFKHPDIFIVNVHIKMDYPGILKSIVELYDCITTSVGTDGMRRTIVMGDFNAHALQASKELYTSSLNTQMFDLFASELIDDHVFVGNDIRIFESVAALVPEKDLPMLEIQVNTPATGRKWILASTKYNRSPMNQELIDRDIATSDHQPVIIIIDFDHKRAKRGSYL